MPFYDAFWVHFVKEHWGAEVGDKVYRDTDPAAIVARAFVCTAT